MWGKWSTSQTQVYRRFLQTTEMYQHHLCVKGLCTTDVQYVVRATCYLCYEFKPWQDTSNQIVSNETPESTDQFFPLHQSAIPSALVVTECRSFGKTSRSLKCTGGWTYSQRITASQLSKITWRFLKDESPRRRVLDHWLALIDPNKW